MNSTVLDISCTDDTEVVSDQQQKSLVHHIAQQIPFIIILLGLLMSFLVIVIGHWRKGTALIGGIALAASAFRAFLPTAKVGLLHVRGKWQDTLWYGICGIIIVVLSITIESNPGT